MGVGVVAHRERQRGREKQWTDFNVLSAAHGHFRRERERERERAGVMGWGRSNAIIRPHY